MVRTSYFKYFHPKEALITNGVLNRSLNQTAHSLRLNERDDEQKQCDTGNGDISAGNDATLSFVYPFGATLNVQKPSAAVLSTGTVCYPLQRPICAFYSDTSKPTPGKIVVLGSAHLFHDQYLDKEDNRLLKDIVMTYLTTNEIALNPIDAKDPEVADYHAVPDLETLCDAPFSCLQEGEVIVAQFGHGD